MICYNLFPGGKRKALTLSYDDGVYSDIRLMDIMRRHGIKGTFNVNAGLMNGNKEKDPETYRIWPEEYGAYEGFELAVHGYTHPFLDRMAPDQVLDEIVSDRRGLEQLAGYPVHGMAYPYGTYNAALIEQLRHLGIYYSRTTRATFDFKLPEEFLAWHPTCHHNAENLMELCDKFLAEPEKKNVGLRVFYLWGHSYEFVRNDNWNVIEKFCEKMGGRDNIWYATNMEIYEYMQALKRLDYSIDGSMVHNPSSVPVWIACDGPCSWTEEGVRVVCVAPGETKKL